MVTNHIWAGFSYMHVNSTCEEQKQECLCKVQPKNHWLMSDNNGAFYCLIKMCVEFKQWPGHGSGNVVLHFIHLVHLLSTIFLPINSCRLACHYSYFESYFFFPITIHEIRRIFLLELFLNFIFRHFFQAQFSACDSFAKHFNPLDCTASLSLHSALSFL